ncbi:MAG: murein transglycosylase A [Gammaproteobacteria bacterium]|nr:murein transglycosylase A [Gammaproteobacteria bacterium]
MRISLTSFSVLLCLLLGACVKPAGIGNPVDWSKLSGWETDQHAEAWPALISGCNVLSAKTESWKNICRNAQVVKNPTDEQARSFFEQHFEPHRVNSGKWKNQGLITGYYEPLLHGSFKPTQQFKYPIYRRPDELLTVDLDDLYTDLKGKRTRGRLQDNRVVPFYSRSEIDGPGKPLQGSEILWVDDRDALFFLHVQGSGRVQLPDGDVVNVGYADQNGHPYVSIGRVLIDRSELKKKEVSLFTIRDWLRKHPNQAQSLLNENSSYVFFELSDNDNQGPTGSLNVPLTAKRSAAVDPNTISLGTPLWIETELLDSDKSIFNQLIFAQDTGGAIKGSVRADIFWGHGDHAEQMAGKMKQKGKIYALLPRSK